MFKLPKKYACAIIFILTLTCCFFEAPAEILPIKIYTSADGLIYEGVLRVYQDSRGFIWATTPVGLSRFDGYQFTRYGIEDGLYNTLMTDMVEDNNGVYWFGTMNGIIYRLDPKSVNERTPSKKFEDFKISETNPYINRIYKTSDGTVYIAAMDGLYRLDDSRPDNKFIPVEINAEHKNAPVANLVEDAAGSLWISYQYGLIRRLPDGSMIRYEVLPNATGSDLVRALAVDAANRIWMNTEDRHLIVFNPEPIDSLNPADEPRRKMRFDQQNKLVANLGQGDAHRFTAEECPGDGAIRAIRPTQDGKIWLSAYQKGLISFDGNEFRLYTKANGLSDNRLTGLTEDSFGNLWIASDWGLMKLSRKGFVTYKAEDGLGDERISNLFQDRDGKIYAVNQDWIVNRFEGRKFTSFKLNIPALPEDWLSHKVLLDGAGDWWFATKKGLYRYAAPIGLERINQSKPTAHYTTAQGLPTDNIFGVFSDSNDNVWITFGDDKGDHLMRWDRKTESFQTFNKTDGIAENCMVRHFSEDAAGNLYFGCSEQNIVVYRQGKFFSFRSAYLPEGLWFAGMLLDSKERIWVASPTRGLVKIENLLTGDPTERLYTKADGLSNVHIQFMTEDNAGKIYFVTANSMDVLEPETGKIKQYTLADGLVAAGTGTAIRDKNNGDIWLGVSRGISRFTPEADKMPVPPPVFISNIRVAGKDIPISALGETQITDLTLEPDQRNLQIDFYGLSLSSGDALRYQYKIEGTGEDWSDLTAQRSVNLNLSAGSYKFLVRALTLEGATSITPASVSFKVLRPFWQQWWFLLLLTLLIVGVVYLIYRYRLRKLLELEKIRMRIATDLHDDIGASLSKIAILSEVVHQRVTPFASDEIEINEPLEHIAGTSREMVDSMSDIVWAINPAKDHLSDLIQRMRNLAGEMTELRDIRLKVNLSAIEGRDLQAGADLRRDVYLIFKETINNLIKHSECAVAEIEFRIENENFIVIVKDDGKGFSELTGGNGNLGGNGLPNMKKRAAGLGGSYEIESVEGKGTTAVLRVPMTGNPKRRSVKTFFAGRN